MQERRTDLRLIDGRANPRSRRDDRKIENATLTYEVEELGRQIVHLARRTRLALLTLDEGGPDRAA